MERTHVGTREKPGEERAERNCYGLTTAPFPHVTVLLDISGGGRGVGKGLKLSLGRKGVV